MSLKYWTTVVRIKAPKDDGDFLPGSLKAMCPSSPMPPKNSSIPPKDLIRSSYALHSLNRSSTVPSRIFTWDGGISTTHGGGGLE